MGSVTEGKATSFLWDSKSLGPDVFIRLPSKSRDKMKGPQAYVSFGDEGTTASINAFGHIMQISQFARYGSSGFVCADAGYERPYWVTDRMRHLMKAATDPEQGLRLDLVEWKKLHNVPSLGYMHDRWPRYIYDQKPAEKSGDSAKNPKKPDPPTDNTKTLPIPPKSGQSGQKALGKSAHLSGTSAFPLSIQYFCDKGTIIQKYLLNLGEGGLSYDQVKWGDLQLTPYICIRDLDFVNCKTFDENLNSSALTRDVISENTLVISYDILSPDSAKDDKTQTKVGTDEKPLTAALFISPFVNGKATKIEEGNCIRIVEADCQTPDGSPTLNRLEISIAYTLRVLPKSTMERLKSFNDKSTPELIKAENSVNAMNDEFQEDSEFCRVYFSQSAQLDLAYRRHLEHILSVCCIPLLEPDEVGSKADDANSKTAKADSKADKAKSRSIAAVATAITCGDISGHRIGPRASLWVLRYIRHIWQC